MTFNNNFIAEVKCNGRILRIRDGIAYLPFGSEYSILLKNLDTRRASVQIHIDGDDVLDGHSLIVEPNKTTELQGYMKGNVAKNRFKFIHKTDEISDYRGDKADDGIIRVQFAFEKKPNKIRQIITEHHHEHHDHHHHHHHHDWYYPRTTWIYNSSFSSNQSLADVSKMSSDVTYTNNAGDAQKDGIMPDPVTGQSDCRDFEPLGYDHDSQTINQTFNSQELKTPIDDLGITVPGSEVHQRFHYGSIGTLEDEGVIVIQMRGETSTGTQVKKPITTKTKITCKTCGRKSKSSHKFCSNCGTFLE